MLPTDLRLPVREFRANQSELISRLATSPMKYVLLQAPTGVGKSLTAVSLRRLTGFGAIVLTGTKTLQDQYLRDFGPSGMVKAIGRGNFRCNTHSYLTADKAPCTWGAKCVLKHSDGCDYYEQKIRAENSPEAVLNYAYWLAQANYVECFTPVDLLVCDEAHTVEDEVRKFVTIKLTDSHLSACGLGRMPAHSELGDWKLWATRQVPKVWQRVVAYDEHSQQAKMLNDMLDKLHKIEKLDDENWLVIPVKTGVEFRPVWVDQLAGKLIFDHAERVVLMSATILDPGAFCTNLGIPQDEVEFIDVPSSFPRERRPLIYAPVGRVGNKNEAALDRLVAKVDSILDHHAGRGLVHTSNYRVAQHIIAHSQHLSRLRTHTTETRAKALADLKATPGRVLVSPSMGTGVDLPYKECEFQIICKLPFPDLGDPQVKRRMRKGPDGKPLPKGQNWYNHATASALVQSYGRGMRAPDDNCVTYLLDGNWGWFWPNVRHMLPDWFKEAFRRESQGEKPPEISVRDQIAKLVGKGG